MEMLFDARYYCGVGGILHNFYSDYFRKVGCGNRIGSFIHSDVYANAGRYLLLVHYGKREVSIF